MTGLLVWFSSSTAVALQNFALGILGNVTQSDIYLLFTM